MPRSSASWPLVAAAVAGVLFACNRGPNPASPPEGRAVGSAASEAAPTIGRLASPAAQASPSITYVDFTLPDLDGNAVRLRRWRGHPMVIDFWATWCPPCRKQVPELNDIYHRYRRKGLVAVGVSCDSIQGDGLKAVRPFLQQYKVAYPILMGDNSTIDALGLVVVPTTLLVRPNGRLLEKVEGAGRPGQLSQAIQKLLDQDSSNPQFVKH